VIAPIGLLLKGLNVGYASIYLVTLLPCLSFELIGDVLIAKCFALPLTFNPRYGQTM